MPNVNSTVEFSLNPSLNVSLLYGFCNSEPHVVSLSYLLKLVVRVSAFGEIVDLTLSLPIFYSGTMDATPSPGNSVQVDSQISSVFMIRATSSGTFLQTNLTEDTAIMIFVEASMITNVRDHLELELLRFR